MLKTCEKWRVDVIKKIRRYFNDPQDVDDILKIYIPNNKSEDKKNWPFSRSGQVTIKSTHRVMSTRSISNSMKFYLLDTILKNFPPIKNPHVWVEMLEKSYFH